MRKFHCSWAVLALAFAASAGAQTPAKPDAAAEAAAAMERAKRQAAGPMRIILEASKARRKPGDAEAAPAAPAAATATATATAPSEAIGLRSVASRTPAPVAITSTNAAPAAAVVAPVVAASAPPAAVIPAAPAASPDGVQTQVTLEAGALGAKPATTAVSGLESSSVVGPIIAPLAVAPQVASSQMLAGDRVRLLSMVEPEVPQRMLDEMGRNATIQVDLVLRADGSVASVDLASPAPRGLLRMLTPSLEQWKFAPLTAQRTHRVELLFNVER